MKKISGAVTSIRSSSVVHGNIRKGKGQVSSTEKLNFLIDGTAVFYSDGENMNVSEGDVVSVAGSPKASGLNALAFVNHTNDTFGDNHAKIYKWVAVLLFALCVVSVFLLLPSGGGTAILIIIFLPIAVPCLMMAKNRERALAMCRMEP